MKKLLYTLCASLFVVVGIVAYNPTQTYAQGLKPPDATTEQVKSGDLGDNPIIQWIEFFVNVLSVTILAGGSVMIAWAGIQYMSSRDNAQAVQDAKNKIWNVVYGLLAYFFLYAFIQWIIPGGVF